MAKTIEINHGVQTFDEHIDTSRNNPDRKQWGRGDTDFHIGEEYDQPTPQADTTPPPAPPTKFTHKLGNGTVLEAESVEALAAKIEQAVKTVVVEDKWDDAPVYQPMEFKPRELSVQEQAMLLNEWPRSPQKVIRALQEAEYGAPMDKIIAAANRGELMELEKKQMEAGVAFMEEVAEVYNATPANAKKLTEYLKGKQKPITKNNLVKAFKELSPNDANLLRKQEEEEPEESIEPPTILQSNQGLPPSAPAQAFDETKFRSMSLQQQKEFFAAQRRAR